LFFPFGGGDPGGSKTTIADHDFAHPAARRGDVADPTYRARSRSGGGQVAQEPAGRWKRSSGDRRFSRVPRIVSVCSPAGQARVERLFWRAPLFATFSLLLSGCTALLKQGGAAGAGVAGASLAGAVTRDPAVTAGIGLGLNAAASAGVKAIEKRVHRTEQDSIAAAAGPLGVGESAKWSSGHYKVSVEANEHGELTVSRLIRAANLDCKEIVFSVDAVVKHKPDRSFYTAIICRDGASWKWATAEPATERWGSLQ